MALPRLYPWDDGNQEYLREVINTILDALDGGAEGANTTISGGTVTNPVLNGSVPAVPAGLAVASSAIDNLAQVYSVYANLTWTANGTGDHVNVYEIQYRKQNDTNYYKVQTGLTSIKIPGLIPGQAYSFSIRALNTYGWSTFSSEVTSTMPSQTATPAVPTGLTVTGVIRGYNVLWNANGEADLAGYVLQVSSDNTTWSTAMPQALQTTFYFELTNGSAIATARYFRVAAVNRAGLSSAYSASVSGTTAGLSAADFNTGIVNTSAIVNGAVTNAILASGSVATGNIQNSAITSALLASGAVTSAALAANAVTQAAIAANAVGTAQIAANAITSGLLAAGAVTSSAIASGAVTAGALSVTIGGTNIITNSSVEDGTNLGAFVTEANTTFSRDNAHAFDGTWSAKFVANTVATGHYGYINSIPAIAGVTYTGSVWVYSTTAQSLFLSLAQYAPVQGAGVVNGATVSVPANTWTRLQVTRTAGSTETSQELIVNGFAVSSTVWVDAWQVEVGDVATAYAPRVGEVLPSTITTSMIQNNAITNALMASGAVGTSNIQANAVTTGLLAANAVGTGQLATGAVTNPILASGSVATGNIQNNAITSALLASGAVNSAALAANAVTQAAIASGAVTASALSVQIGGGNIVANSGFEAASLSTGSWYNRNNVYETIAISSSQFQSGSQSAAITIVALGGVYALHDYSINQNVATTNNGPYVGSAYLKAPAGRTVGIRIVRTANGTTQYGSAWDTSTTITSNGNWQRVVTPVNPSWTGAGNTSAFEVRIGYDSTGANGAVNDVIYVDNAQLERGDIATDYAPMAGEILPGTVTGSQIAGATITQSNVASGAIGTAQLISGAVTNAILAVNAVASGNVQAGAIGTTQIASGAITAALLAANAVTSSAIAANAVTQAAIAAGAVGTAQVAANAITSGLLAAGAVNNAALAANAVQQGNIASGAVGTAQIAANAVTSGLLAAGAVNNAALAANAVQQGNIASGAVGNAQIAASAVQAGNLAVTLGGGNYYSNSSFEDSTAFNGWSVSGATIDTTTAWDGAASAKITAGSYQYVSSVGAGDIVAVAGQTYIISAYIKTDSAFSSTSGAGIYIEGTATTTVTKTNTPVANQGWTREIVKVVVTASGTIHLVLTNSYGGTSTGNIWFDAIQAELGDVPTAYAPKASELLTGNVGTTNIAANAITTGKIAAGAVTASQIAANTITAGQIAAGTITATQIASGTITAAQIAAATITGSQIAANTIAASNIVSNTITAAQIAANTITAGQIAAGTITTTQIASGTIVAGNIAAGTITGTQIAATTIAAGNIVSGTITSTQIAANTITASNIVSGTITTAQIAAGTITGGNIAAGTITGSNVAATTISASNIVSGTITSAQIAANTITAGNIAAATITGAQIAAATIAAGNIVAGTITSSQIAANTITGGNIAAGTITGDRINSGTITTTNLTAGFQQFLANPDPLNALKNPGFENGGAIGSGGSFWGNQGGASIVNNAANAHTGNYYLQLASVGTGGAASFQVDDVGNATVYWPVSPGAVVYWGGWGYRESGDAACRIVLEVTDKDKANTYYAAGSNVTTAAWTQVANTYTVPAGKAYIRLYAENTGGTVNTTSRWDDIFLTIQLPGAGIVAGSITADRIAANAITAAQIAAGTITSTQIAANTITAGNIASGTITTTQIAAGTIVASNIASGTITASQIAGNTITAAQIAAGTITTTQIASGTIVAGNIAAGTITGTQIAATTISASNIVANTITAAQIAAATITATQIAASTITSSQIANSTITGGNIANATITGANIQANTVATTNLTVGSFQDSAIPNGSFEDLDPASTTLPASWSGVTGGTATVITRSSAVTAQSGAYSAALQSNLGSPNYSRAHSKAIPVTPGDNWYYSVWYRTDVAATGGYCRIGYFATDPGTSVSDGTYTDFAGNLSGTTSWQNANTLQTVPAGMYWARVILYNYQPNATSTFYFDGIEVRKAVGTANILNAAIKNAQIDQLAVATANIQDSAIVTAKINNLAVNNAKINDVAVDKLTAGNLTVTATLTAGGTINIGNPPSAAGIQINTTGIKGYGAGGANTFSLLASDGSIALTGPVVTNGSITGATIAIGSANAIFKADTSGIYLGNAVFSSAPFRVDLNGNLTATSATITGTINASGGTFSGTITASGTISGGTLSGATITGGTIAIGSANAIFKADSNGIYLGNAVFGSAPFRVDMNGNVTTTGNFTGGSNTTITGGTFQTGTPIDATHAGVYINSTGLFVYDGTNVDHGSGAPGLALKATTGGSVFYSGGLGNGIVGGGNLSTTAPGVPSGLAINASGISNVAQTNNAWIYLTWTANPAGDYVGNYEVRYRKTPLNMALSAALAPNTTYTSISVTSVPYQIGAGQTLQIGTGTTQNVITTGVTAANAGVTTINVNSFSTGANSFTSGVAVVMLDQQWTAIKTGTNNLRLDNLFPGVTYDFQIRAQASTSSSSAWSATVTGGQAVDNVAPATPTNLIAYKTPRGAALTWGANTEQDFYGVNLRVTTNGGTSWTTIATNFRGTSYLYNIDRSATALNASLQFAIQAVDFSGNSSAWSAATTALTVDGVLFDEILAGNLTVLGTLTGSGGIQTANGGQRVQVDTTGIKTYSAANAVTATLAAGSGSLTLSGNITSSGTITGGTIVGAAHQSDAAVPATGTRGTFLIDVTNGIQLWDKNSNRVLFADINTGNLTLGNASSSGALTLLIGSANSIFKADSNGIYLGNATFASAPFRVDLNGNLTATSATITGTINATSSNFSGNITASGVKGSYFYGDTTTAAPTLPTIPVGSGVGSLLLDPVNGLRFWNGNGTSAVLQAQWTTAGQLTIYSGASIYGSTVATSQSLGTSQVAGVKIDSSGLAIWSYYNLYSAQAALHFNYYDPTNGAITDVATVYSNYNRGANPGGGTAIGGLRTDALRDIYFNAGQDNVATRAAINFGFGSAGGLLTIRGDLQVNGNVLVNPTSSASPSTHNVPVVLASGRFSSQTSIAVSNIPGTFKTIKLMFSNYPAVASGELYVRFNGDATANYFWNLVEASGGAGPVGYSGGAATTYARVGYAVNYAAVEVTIPGYASSAISKSFTALCSRWDSYAISGGVVDQYSCLYAPTTTAVTSITFGIAGGGNLGQYGDYTVLGIP